MDKSPDAFRTISEVAEWLGVQAHVLRFWESKFAQVKPVKRAGGRRYYRPADMLLLGGIKKLLHEDGLTVKGTQKILREQGVAHVSDLSQELCDVAADTAQKMVEYAKVVPFKGDAAAPEVEEVAAPRAEATPAAQPKAPAIDAEQAPADEVAPPPKAKEEQPMLPSFLHRPAAATQSGPDPTPDPVAEVKPSLVVDAPDPPDESDLPYTRGALAHLSRMKRLNGDQAAQIAPLAKELQGWLDRTRGAGAS